MSKKNNTIYPDTMWERMLKQEEEREAAIREIQRRKDHPPKITKSNKKDFWLSPQGMELMRHYARQGYNQSEIADLIGVDKSVISRWKREFPPLEHLLAESAEIALAKVENAMYDMATGHNQHGDFRAAKFVLINRGENWQDEKSIKHDIDADVEQQVVILDDLSGLDLDDEDEEDEE